MRESAGKLIQRCAGPDRHRALRDSGAGFDRTVWTAIAEAGWLAVLLPEDAGGSAPKWLAACAAVPRIVAP